MTAARRRPARYRSIYSNGIPLWMCGRCGDQRLANTPEQQLADHEASCGQPRRDQETK